MLPGAQLVVMQTDKLSELVTSNMKYKNIIYLY